MRLAHTSPSASVGRPSQQKQGIPGGNVATAIRA